MPRVSALHIYPIKGCGGLKLTSVRFDALGPLYDRRWMLVDDAGVFLSQRKLPQLALIKPILAPTALHIEAKGMQRVSVPLAPRNAPRRQVSVWRHTGSALDAGDDAAEWFSEFLSVSCRLVRFADDTQRLVDPRYARFEGRVGFADGYPVLLLSQASLEDLNLRLSRPLPMDRFRPNLVVEDCDAFAEDGWRQIRAGDVVLDVVKPCGRCVTTTVDQATGETGPEPLATLARYRTRDNEALFGQNCIHHGPGTIRVGDEVEILEVAPLGTANVGGN